MELQKVWDLWLWCCPSEIGVGIVIVGAGISVADAGFYAMMDAGTKIRGRL
ncbi:MAG TPA: hypothetical protein PL168_06845 [Methanobacterium sp.]|jgi:hypothetical protein|nr:hypothetical protein [Methanobacterium sp.]